MKVEGIRAEAIHISWDERGVSTLVIDRAPSPLLAVAFEHDIQTASTAAIVYDRLSCVADGYDSQRSFSGNSCTITISDRGVVISNDILEQEESLEMSVEQYRIILDAWFAYLTA